MDPESLAGSDSSFRDDHALLGSIVALFQSRGLIVFLTACLISEALAPKGDRRPRAHEEERKEILYGNVSPRLVPLSFGQSQVVRAGAVVAVEAMEGTDDMIARAGRIFLGARLLKMMRGTG